jgi:hypothetical protein
MAKKLYHFLANSQKIIPLFGKWPKNYTTFWQIAKKLYHYLANGQKIIPLFGNWPKNYTTFWQIAKKLYHYLANGQKNIPLIFGQLANSQNVLLVRKVDNFCLYKGVLVCIIFTIIAFE